MDAPARLHLKTAPSTPQTGTLPPETGTRKALNLTRLAATAALFLAWLLPAAAEASEGGSQQQGLAIDASGAGMLPAPGGYFLNYVVGRNMDRFETDNAAYAKSHSDYHVNQELEIPRFYYIFNKKLKFLGNATIGMGMFQPLVRSQVQVGSKYQTTTGIGNTVLDPLMLGWHFGHWHALMYTRVYLPTGLYHKNWTANTGLDYLSAAWVHGGSYYNPQGFELTYIGFLTWNAENHVTHYRSGDSYQFDYFTGWHFGPLSAGATGGFFHQFTGDTGTGAKYGSFMGESFSIGPDVRYAFHHFTVELKYTHDVIVENRPLYDIGEMKVVVPL